MKITGGQAGGLRIDAPAGDRTRPSTNRMRESLFATLRELVPGARVLDLFAGSGSLGLEAASRGAAAVHAVERHPPTARLIEANAAKLAPAGVACPFAVYAAEAERWLRAAPAKDFDLVFADPPYADLTESADLAGLLENIAAPGVLSETGLVAVEIQARLKPEIPIGWRLIKRKDYGATSVLLLDLG